MKTDRYEGDYDHCSPGEGEGPPGHCDTIAKVVQPSGGGNPGQGYTDGKCDADQHDEILCEQQGDVEEVRPQYLANTYFLRALYGADGGQAKEPQQGQEDGEGGKEGEQLTRALFRLVEAIIIFIEKMVIEGAVGNEFFPGCLEAADLRGQLCAVDADQHIPRISRIGEDHERAYRLVHRGDVEIADDSFDNAGLVFGDRLADRFLRRPTDFADCGFIQDKPGVSAGGIVAGIGSAGGGIGIGMEVGGSKIAAGQEVHVHRRNEMKISRDSVNGEAHFFAAIMCCQGIGPTDGYGKVIGSGYVDNARQLTDGCLQCIVAGVDLVIDRQHQYMVP